MSPDPAEDVDERVAELEAQVAALQDRSVEDQLESAALRQLVWGLADGEPEDYDTIVRGAHAALETVEAMADRIESLETETEQLRGRLDKLGDIGEQKTTKEQKIASIVTFADNQRAEAQDAIAVKPSTIKGLVDVTQRYAYVLVDDLIDEFDWAHDPGEVQRYGSAERNAPDKSVVIDFEGVHGDPVPLNKFINESAETGVAN